MSELSFVLSKIRMIRGMRARRKNLKKVSVFEFSAPSSFTPAIAVKYGSRKKGKVASASLKKPSVLKYFFAILECDTSIPSVSAAGLRMKFRMMSQVNEMKTHISKVKVT